MVAIVAWLAVMVMTASGARAADDEAEAIIKHGVALRKERKDHEALAEFQRAAQIERTPRVVGQMALAEVAIGMWPAAEEHLKEALAHGKDPWVGKNRAALQQTLAGVEPHLGALEIWGTPAGAEIVVDGKPVGKLPLANPVHVVAGMLTVTLQAKGYQSISRTLQVTGQKLTRENMDLAALPQPTVDLTAREASPLVSHPPPPEGGTLIVHGQPPAEAAPTADQPLVKRWWFWAALGVVLVGGAVAAVALLGDRAQIPTCPAHTDCARP